MRLEKIDAEDISLRLLADIKKNQLIRAVLQRGSRQLLVFFKIKLL